MPPRFVTDYTEILNKLNAIEPIKYGNTRNHIDGAITYLSPYISRGVISTKQVLLCVLEKGYTRYQIETLVKELCWRDYFQRVAQAKDINTDIKQPQEPVVNEGVPINIINAATGISAIDDAIKNLYQTGYMHNHCRMYTASVVCNIAKCYWKDAAQWMYYYLLDGDWASNTCSWQWVAAANSNRKYYANQDNINKYTNTKQKNTFLDKSYEDLEQTDIPEQVSFCEKAYFSTALPNVQALKVEKNIPTFIYNYYNLDPVWHKEETGNRILLLEPDFFKQYPVSKKCIDFVLALSKNINNIQVYIGSFKSLAENYLLSNIFYKEHPLNIGYKGTEESRDWIATNVIGYHPSFFNYWKKIEKNIPF